MTADQKHFGSLPTSALSKSKFAHVEECAGNYDARKQGGHQFGESEQEEKGNNNGGGADVSQEGLPASIQSVQDVPLFNGQGEYCTEQEHETEQQYKLAMILVGEHGCAEPDIEQIKKDKRNMDSSSSSACAAAVPTNILSKVEYTSESSEGSCSSCEQCKLINLASSSSSSTTATAQDFHLLPRATMLIPAKPKVYDDPFSIIKELKVRHKESTQPTPSLTTMRNAESEQAVEMDEDDALPRELFSSPLSFPDILSPPQTLYEIEKQPFQKDWSLFEQIESLLDSQPVEQRTDRHNGTEQEAVMEEYLDSIFAENTGSMGSAAGAKSGAEQLSTLQAASLFSPNSELASASTGHHAEADSEYYGGRDPFMGRDRCKSDECAALFLLNSIG